MKEAAKNLKIIKTVFAPPLTVALIYPAHSQAMVKSNFTYVSSGTQPFIVVDFATCTVHDGPGLSYVDRN